MSSENLKNTIIGHLSKECHFGTSQMRFWILLRVSIITNVFLWQLLLKVKAVCTMQIGCKLQSLSFFNFSCAHLVQNISFGELKNIWIITNIKAVKLDWFFIFVLPESYQRYSFSKLQLVHKYSKSLKLCNLLVNLISPCFILLVPSSIYFKFSLPLSFSLFFVGIFRIQWP